MQTSSLPNCQQCSKVILLLFLFLLSLSFACQTETAAPDTRATDESALRTLDEQWSKAAGAKDVDKTVSYYAADAMVLPPNSPVVTGKESIHALWKELTSGPGFTGGWKPAKIEVARSGDLAYITGSYEFTENDVDGKPLTDRGKYLEVWKKQSDRNWKCVVDMFNSELPESSAPENPTKPGDKTK